MNKGIETFLNSWRAFRSCTEIDIERWFRTKALEYKDEEVFYISERMLQTYLFLNIKDIFPECKELILFERPLLDRKSVNAGRCDFVFLTHKNKLMLIETKVINDEISGSTARSLRNMRRRKVVQQVLRGKSQLHCWFNIPKRKIVCAIVTTDLVIHRRMKFHSEYNIKSAYVSLREIRNWFNEEVKYEKSLVGSTESKFLLLQFQEWK